MYGSRLADRRHPLRRIQLLTFDHITRERDGMAQAHTQAMQCAARDHDAHSDAPRVARAASAATNPGGHVRTIALGDRPHMSVRVPSHAHGACTAMRTDGPAALTTEVLTRNEPRRPVRIAPRRCAWHVESSSTATYSSSGALQQVGHDGRHGCESDLRRRGARKDECMRAHVAAEGSEDG